MRNPVQEESTNSCRAVERRVRRQRDLLALNLKGCTTQPIVNKSFGAFETPEYTQRGVGFVTGKITDLPSLIRQLIERFIDHVGIALENQVRLEILNISELCLISDQSRRSLEQSLECTSFGMGSLTSPGVYVERASYRSFKNISSNTLLSNNTLCTVNNVTGSHILSSWVDISFSKRVLNITFAVPLKPEAQKDGLRHEGYRLSIPFAAFLELDISLNFSADEILVLLRLKFPPHLWKATSRYRNGKWILNLTESSEWTRVLEVSSGCVWELSRAILGRSSVLAIGLPRNPPVPAGFEFNAESEHIDLDVIKRQLQESMVVGLLGSLGRVQELTKCYVYFTGLQRLREGPLRDVVYPEFSSFRVNYAVHGLMERGYCVLDQIYLPKGCAGDGSTVTFFDSISRAYDIDKEACEESLEDLLGICDDRRLMNLQSSFEKLFAQKHSAVQHSILSERLQDLPKNSVLVRKVIITPLRRIFLPPQVMMSNRVVRNFGQDYALRCTFRDENGSRVKMRYFIRGRTTTPENFKSQIVEEMIKNVFLKPVTIGCRDFHFLAWSNSQLRDHGCYLFANSPVGNRPLVEVETDHYTVADIRKWMGDFSAIRNVPKLMSRMGQCFTQAQPTVSLRSCDWKIEEDFVTVQLDPQGKPYIFSDGVGRISQRFANRIAAILELDIVPSCFQFRFKGFKGILVVWPNFCPNLYDPDVVFRESQKKFEDNDDESKAVLEVVKYSMPSVACLNRPLIMILDQVSRKQGFDFHQRIRKKIMRICEEELDSLGAMLSNDSLASQQLSSRCGLPISFHDVLMGGIRVTDEPFFRSLLVAIYRYCISQDMIKMKIPLPPSAGRTMFGVIDELGYLNSGQVFFQYSPDAHTASSRCVPFVGRVVVTKNPCHVPGDVRIFEAVDLPEYRHLRDVIVFPRYGLRPHTDEMAGSDLDGDEYTVIFDESFFLIQNEKAMQFPKQSATQIDHSPSTEEVADFFLNYLEQDTIGRVSNAHLIAADMLGIYHSTCEQLAAKCSVAVDFPKTGHPAEPLTEEERFDTVPDFMGISSRNSYPSKSLLGRLFRKVNILETLLNAPIVEAEDSELPVDHLLIDEENKTKNKECWDKAIELRDLYYAKIQQILDEYGIESEGEMFSGHSVSIRRITEMEKQDYSLYHVDRLVEHRLQQINLRFRSEFFEEFGGEKAVFEEDAVAGGGRRKNFIGTEAVIRKASIWYSVGYGVAAEGIRFRSFPWIVWDMLLVARRHTLIRKMQEPDSKIPPTLRSADSVAHRKLNIFIGEFAQRHTEEMESFVYWLTNSTNRIDCFENYVCAYGSALANMLLVLDSWLNSKCGFSRHHLVLLAIQFGRGIRRCQSSRVVRDVDYLPEHIPSLSVAQKYQQQNSPLSDRAAPFLLGFVRYLGSTEFAQSEQLILTTGDLANRLTVLDEELPLIDFGETKKEETLAEPDGPSLVLCDPHDWIPISQLAYQTFHYVSLTRDYDCFVQPLTSLITDYQN